MALPTGLISLADLQAQLGGANPIGLNEYYRGGAYTPTGIIQPNGPIATSGTISLATFRGAYINPIVLNLLWVDNNSAIRATNPAQIDGQNFYAGSAQSNDAVGLSGIGHFLRWEATGGAAPYTFTWTITPGNLPAARYGWWWGSSPDGTKTPAWGVLTNSAQVNIFPVIRGTDEVGSGNYTATQTVTISVTDSNGVSSSRSVYITTSLPYASAGGGSGADG